jgi:hypothetical protein
MPFDYGTGANGNAHDEAATQEANARQASNTLQQDINSIGSGNWGDTSKLLSDAQAAQQPFGAYQNPRPEYGGYAGGANDAANYYKQLGEQYGSRGPVQADLTLAGQSRGQEQDANSLLRNAAYGNAPSAAENTFNQSLSRSIMAQQAGANSARGGGANLAAAQGQASQQAAEMQNAGAQQAAAIRAQEMAQARGAYAQQTLAQQGIDTNTAFGQAQLQQQGNALNQQGQLQALGLGEQAQEAQLNADVGRFGAQTQATTAANQLQAQQSNAQTSALMGMGGAALAFLSDIAKKDEIAPAGGKMAPKDDSGFKSNPFINAAGNAIAAYGAGIGGRQFTPIQTFDAAKQKQMLDARARVGPDNAGQRNAYSPMYPSMKPPLAQVVQQPAPPPITANPAAAQNVAAWGNPAGPQDMPLPPSMYTYMKGLNGGEIDQSKWKITPDQAPPPPVPAPYVGSDINAKTAIAPAGVQSSMLRPQFGQQQQPQAPMGMAGMQHPQQPFGVGQMSSPPPPPRGLAGMQSAPAGNPYGASSTSQGMGAQIGADMGAGGLMSDERVKMLMQPAGQEDWYGRGLLTGHADPNRDYPMHEVGFRKEAYPAGIMSDERAKYAAFRAGQFHERYDLEPKRRGVFEETARILTSPFGERHEINDFEAPMGQTARSGVGRPITHIRERPPLHVMQETHDSVPQVVAFHAQRPPRMAGVESPSAMTPREVGRGVESGYTGEPRPEPRPAYAAAPPQLPPPPPPPMQQREEEPPVVGRRPGLLSDERTKDHDGGSFGNEADHFLAALHPYTYKYKHPSYEPTSSPTGGQYLGVMAQDVERTPVGPQIVKDTPRGKMLEGGALMSALAAGVGRLHERLSALEGGGRKKVG